MTCYCCGRPASVTRRVHLRGDVTAPPAAGSASPSAPAYLAYTADATFRPAFVCPACYGVLDGPAGTGRIGGRVYGIAGRSRGRRAPVYGRARYEAYARKRASDLGLDAG